MSFLEDFKNIDDTLLYPPTSNKELLPSQSGTHFIVSPDTVDRGIRLPPPTQKGMRFMFTKGDATNSNEIVFSANGYLFTGTIIRTSSTIIDGSKLDTSDNISWIYLTNNAVVGDFIQMIADGTSWVITACSNATVGIGIDPV